MIKLTDKHNLYNIPVGLSHSYSVQPQFTHSSSDMLQLWDLKSCLCLLAWVGMRVESAVVMFLIHPFPS